MKKKMKERLLASMKKIVVMLIATVMLLGLVPVGLMFSQTTVRAEGEFLRMQPEAEACVGAYGPVSENNIFTENDGTLLAGGSYDACFRFDIRHLLDKKTEEVKRASLRMVLLRTPVEKPSALCFYWMKDGWDASVGGAKKLVNLNEVFLGKVSVPAKEETPKVIEVDVTAYLKQWMEKRTEVVSLRVDGWNADVVAVCAGKGYEDPAYRPALKVVTGNAQDSDSMDITKVWRKSMTISRQSMDAEGEMVLREGDEIHLQYGIHPENIQGAIYQATLELKNALTEPETEIGIYQIPEGKDGTEQEKERVYFGEIPEYDGVDLSYLFHQAYQEKKRELNVVVKVVSGTVILAEEPALKIKASDDENVQAVMEALLYALGENASATEITGNLPKKHTNKEGKTAEIKWKTTDAETGESAGDVIFSDGKVWQPQWFEESRNLLSVATVTAGDYSRTRTYALRVVPADMPKEEPKYGNMVLLGDSDSEKANHFASAGTVAKSRFVGGRMASYRVLPQEGTMALQMAIHGEQQNYLTLKIWAEDAFAGVQVRSLTDRSLEPITITRPPMAVADDGFLYLTCALPLSYTEGRDYSRLQIKVLPQGLEEGAEQTASIYGAYMTQTPYFDPAEFVDDGEVLVKNLSFNDSALYQFVQKIVSRFENAGQIRQVIETQEEKDPQMITAESEDCKLMVAILPEGKKAAVYRETPYYSAYAIADVATAQEKNCKAINYGDYRIFWNQNEEGTWASFQTQKLSGLYQELLTGKYYQFMKEGQMADSSVLPEGTIVEDGKNFLLSAGETAVLKLVADPLACPDWRVAEINRKSVVSMSLKESMQIETVTLKNLGTGLRDSQTLELVCGVYERGILAGMQKTVVTILPGEVVAEVSLPKSLSVTPGQTLRIFLVPEGESLQALVPALEIP